jgi:prolipoprotein diacylglyceryltransferase
VIGVALAGVLIRLGNFMNSEIYGHPTGSGNGVFYAWDITETLLNNGDMVERIDYVKDQGRDPKPNGAQPIVINLYMKNGNYSEADYTLYLENTVNRILGGYTFISDHVDEPINHNLDYDLSKKTDGRYTAKIRTYAIPRYPTQLFESSSYLLVFIILYLIWRKEKENSPPGKIFGYFLVILWGFRFSWEFLKENQVAFEGNLPLNMGQLLSIPLILVGFYLIYRARFYKAEVTSG